MQKSWKILHFQQFSNVLLRLVAQIPMNINNVNKIPVHIWCRDTSCYSIHLLGKGGMVFDLRRGEILFTLIFKKEESLSGKDHKEKKGTAAEKLERLILPFAPEAKRTEVLRA